MSSRTKYGSVHVWIHCVKPPRPPLTLHMRCHDIICTSAWLFHQSEPQHHQNMFGLRHKPEVLAIKSNFGYRQHEISKPLYLCMTQIHPFISSVTRCFSLETNIITTLVFSTLSHQIKVGKTVFLCVRLLFSTRSLLMGLMWLHVTHPRFGSTGSHLWAFFRTHHQWPRFISNQLCFSEWSRRHEGLENHHKRFIFP